MQKSNIQKKIDMLSVYDQFEELKKKPQLLQLFLEVTSRCNARCEHCGSSCGEKIPKDEIETEYLLKTLKEIADKYDSNQIMLNVTGGEPFLRKDVFEIMEYAIKLGFHWGVTSNGMLIDEKMAKKIEDTKMESISISIDGLKETHESFRRVPGSFDKILNALKLLRKNPNIKWLQVTTVANKKNFQELEELYKLLSTLEIDEWRLINCDPIGRARGNNDILLDAKQYIELFDFIEKKNKAGGLPITYGCSHYLGAEREMTIRPWYYVCQTGLTVCSILSNGDIFGCPNIPRRPELIMGNIRKDSFVEVWENKFEPYRKKRVTESKNCKNCSEFKFCRGDSFHTWDFDNNKPNFCIKEILKEMKK